MAPTFEDLRCRYRTGRSFVVSGTGRNRVYGYRNGVRCALGDIERSEWCDMAKELIQSSDEVGLHNQLLEFLTERNYAKQSKTELAFEALVLHMSRIFDNKLWVGFLPFNQRFRPEIVRAAKIVTVIPECCGEPGVITEQRFCVNSKENYCPHCGKWTKICRMEDQMDITIDMYMQTALDWVIDICADNGLKYRYSDFRQRWREKGISFLAKNEGVENTIFSRGEIAKPKAVLVSLSYDCQRMGKKLKAKKTDFYNYSFCRIEPDGRKEIEFFFTVKELDIRLLGTTETDEGKIESVIKRVQKLLALADTSRNPSEGEALAASMQAQRLLAKYNLDIATVTGKPKEEEISQIIADVGTGNKWKYNLADVIARSYCCKTFFLGHDRIVFYGFQSDALIARRVYMYLFNVGNKLGKKYVKDYRESRRYAPDGLFNDYVQGFTDGIDAELGRQCVALALIVPSKVEDSYKVLSKNFGEMNTDIKGGSLRNENAYQQGKTDGRLALNAQYIEKGEQKKLR